jgi:hypothetical protein
MCGAVLSLSTIECATHGAGISSIVHGISVVEKATISKCTSELCHVPGVMCGAVLSLSTIECATHGARIFM